MADKQEPCPRCAELEALIGKLRAVLADSQKISMPLHQRLERSA